MPRRGFGSAGLLTALVLTLGVSQRGAAQNFEFDRLQQMVREFTVIMKIKVEISMGMQTNEQEQRVLGTVVSEDGLVVFDGSFLSTEHPFAAMSGFTMKTTPTKIEVSTFAGKKYSAEFVGIDRFTKLGFARITGDTAGRFKPVRFTSNLQFKVGSWLALYMLLPEFVNPPIAADIGMISTIVEQPERFPLTVGFNPTEMAGVLFDDQLVPVGVLGALMDPGSVNTDAGGMLESFNQFDIPMLGVVTGERLQKMIAAPPRKGEEDRAWLGITLQALTKDIAEFLGVTAPGGIIVNDVMKGSPAEKAGLLIGDIIYELNGQPMDIDSDEKLPVFQRHIAEMAPGTSIEFTVYRPHDFGIDTLRILATLEAAPLTATDAPEYQSKSLEFSVRNLVFSDYMAFNVDVGSLQGVVVSELKPGGLASVGGLQIGDVLQKIGTTTINSIDDVKAAVEAIESALPREVICFIWRDNKTMFVNIKTDWNQ
ncbi:MAG: PDZ domain-containing protein [Candidatus Zixiibacteriota bacterium]